MIAAGQDRRARAGAGAGAVTEAERGWLQLFLLGLLVGRQSILCERGLECGLASVKCILRNISHT